MDKNDNVNNVLSFLSNNIKHYFENLTDLNWDRLTEIRITLGNPLMVSFGKKRYYVTKNGLSNNDINAYIVSDEDIKIITELITVSSVYSYEKYINSGYITLQGGNRVGIVGTCNCIGKRVVSVQNISSFNIRISHEVNGAADVIIDELRTNEKILNTLIISPPGCGKTTILRDIARLLSDFKRVGRMIVCAIVDERFEIAHTYKGKATLDVGKNNFVISGCEKSIAIQMVTRTMSPDVIITDEICTRDDYDAICYAQSSGCSVIASVHGNDENTNEISGFDYKHLFERIVVLSSRNGPGTVEQIFGSENM